MQDPQRVVPLADNTDNTIVIPAAQVPSESHPPLWRQISVLVGGFMVALNVGIVYLWGIILIYVVSYYKNHGETTLTKQLGTVVLPVSFTGMAIACPCSNWIQKKLGSRLAVVATGAVLALSILIASQLQFGGFVVFYSVIGGLCNGPLYIIPLSHGYKFFSKKSIVSGVVASGIGIGTLFFSMVMAGNIINPQNIASHTYYQEKPQLIEVAERVPIFFRYLALAVICLTWTGAALMVDAEHIQDEHKEYQHHHWHDHTHHHHHHHHYPKTEPLKRHNSLNASPTRNSRILNAEIASPTVRNPAASLDERPEQQSVSSQASIQSNLEVPSNECLDLSSIFKTKIFYIQFLIMFLGSNCGLFTSGNYKNYGSLNISNDKLLTLAGSLGSVFNGIFRIIFGLMLTLVPFRTIYITILVLGMAVAVTFQFTVKYEPGIVCYLCLIYGLYAGNYTLFPTISLNIYGKKNGTAVFSVLFMSFALSNWLQFLFTNTIVSKVGGNLSYQIVYYIEAGMCLSALVIYLVFFKEEHDWTELNRQYLQRVGPEQYLQVLNS